MVHFSRDGFPLFLPRVWEPLVQGKLFFGSLWICLGASGWCDLGLGRLAYDTPCQGASVHQREEALASPG